ncbi:hypothetical protein D3C71_2047680 [compost metagenome]
MLFGLSVLAFSSFLELHEENIIAEREKSNRIILFAGFTINAGILITLDLQPLKV